MTETKLKQEVLIGDLDSNLKCIEEKFRLYEELACDLSEDSLEYGIEIKEQISNVKYLKIK